jgi:hypothetical protein
VLAVCPTGAFGPLSAADAGPVAGGALGPLPPADSGPVAGGASGTGVAASGALAALALSAVIASLFGGSFGGAAVGESAAGLSELSLTALPGGSSAGLPLPVSLIALLPGPGDLGSLYFRTVVLFGTFLFLVCLVALKIFFDIAAEQRLLPQHFTT